MKTFSVLIWILKRSIGISLPKKLPWVLSGIIFFVSAVNYCNELFINMLEIVGGNDADPKMRPLPIQFFLNFRIMIIILLLFL